jgi:hypothetical protein
MRLLTSAASYLGCIFSAIQPVTAPSQVDLFDFAEDGTQSDNRQLMAAVDQINRRAIQRIGGSW